MQEHFGTFLVFDYYFFHVLSEAGCLLRSLLDGDFEAVLLSPQVTHLLTGDGSYIEDEDIEAYLERRLLLYLTDGTHDSQTNR